MKPKEKILALVEQQGIIRPREVEACGIPREYLIRLWREGRLERIGRGLYSLPNRQISEAQSLMEVAKQAPKAVICLLSALDFHQLTTQSPTRVWIAIEQSSWRPRITYPPVNVSYFSSESFHFGVHKHVIDGVLIKVYSPAKTVADCFKFRNKIALDVAIEALREAWRHRKVSVDELWEAAKVCRVARIMRPYLEATV